jgi:hypothetical protein
VCHAQADLLNALTKLVGFKLAKQSFTAIQLSKTLLCHALRKIFSTDAENWDLAG